MKNQKKQKFLGEWIVAQNDHFTGPNNMFHSIVKGKKYKIVRENEEKTHIFVQGLNGGIFGWTEKKKF